MSTPLAEIVAHPPLAIRWLVPGAEAIDWAHSSDLDDPTHWLGGGRQLLLTTGRQFAGMPAEGYRSYLERICAAGVVAVGFGTEVLREGTPPELVAACRDAGVPLVEIPYDTPFMAISRFVADQAAAEARERVEWALDAQSAIARVAGGEGGLAAAVGEAARVLGAAVWVFDADAAVIEHATAGESDPAEAREVREIAAGLLRAGRWGERESAGSAVRTLGSAGRLTGAIAWRRAEPFSPVDESVMTMVTALAEVALEHAEDLRVGRRAIMEQLFQLLRDGRVDTVRRAAEVLRIALPTGRFAVLALDGAEVSPALRDTIERRAARIRRGFFAVTGGEHPLLLVEPGGVEAERAFLAGAGVRAGVSSTVEWSELGVGVTQAVRALESAGEGEVIDFATLVGQSFFGLLATSSVAEVAQARLAAVLEQPGGRESLHQAEVWLRHNGRWEPAARELGLHRHSLKLRLDTLATTIGVSLDTFQGRAELWALLAATR